MPAYAGIFYGEKKMARVQRYGSDRTNQKLYFA